MIRKKVMEFFIIQMEEDMKVDGKMIIWKGKENFMILMEAYMKVIEKMIIRRV